MPFVPNFLLRDIVGWLAASPSSPPWPPIFPRSSAKRPTRFCRHRPASARVVLHVHVPEPQVLARPYPGHRG